MAKLIPEWSLEPTREIKDAGDWYEAQAERASLIRAAIAKLQTLPTSPEIEKEIRELKRMLEAALYVGD